MNEKFENMVSHYFNQFKSILKLFIKITANHETQN